MTKTESKIYKSRDLRTILEGIRPKIIAYNIIGMTQGEGFRDKPVPDYPEWAIDLEYKWLYTQAAIIS
jgi:hypothetical protein